MTGRSERESEDTGMLRMSCTGAQHRTTRVPYGGLHGLETHMGPKLRVTLGATPATTPHKLTQTWKATQLHKQCKLTPAGQFAALLTCTPRKGRI
jgi:hypothetical protein